MEYEWNWNMNKDYGIVSTLIYEFDNFIIVILKSIPIFRIYMETP